MPEVTDADAALLYHSRHMLLEEIGVEGVRRIGGATALVVGMGGLGCPAAAALAAAGIGTLVIVDDDEVDLTNLQRQTLYAGKDIGKGKAECARDALSAAHPDTQVVPVGERLCEGNAARILKRAEVVLDGSDNFPTRHLVNRVCRELGTPLVSGAAIRFEAQASAFDFRCGESPCYACLFPPDGRHEEARCSLLGVFAPLTGMVGCLMAGEALKLVTLGSSALTGNLLLFDMLGARVRSIKVAKDPQCPVCAAR